jgi:hypothetical protein
MLNPVEEKKFAELKEKCRELRVMPPPDVMIKLQVHDGDRVLVFDDIQRGHSWTRNFWNTCAYMMIDGTGATVTFGAGYMNLKYNPTYGYIVAVQSAGIPQCNGLITETNRGIIIGTGDTAFSTEQYGLDAQILHGNGSGQMAYSAHAARTFAYTGGTKTWKTTIYRIFNNNSGGSITVKETGLYATVTSFLIERSVLDPTVAVANAAQLTVTYEISMDFSTID